MLLSDGTSYYIYGAGSQPLEQVNIAAGTITWLHHDLVGSTRLLTNTSGAAVGTASYSPWGQLTASSGTVSTALGWDGQYTDAATGLVYLRARYYDPTTAQFLTVDPDLAGTGQPYAYAGNDPALDTDPLGLFGWNPISDLGEIASAIGGAAEDAADGVGHAAQAVGHALTVAWNHTGGEAAHWAYTHPVAAGIILGGLSLATGGLALVVAAGAPTVALIAGGVSVASGTASAFLEGGPCIDKHDGEACLGMGLGGIGALISGVGGVAGAVAGDTFGATADLAGAANGFGFLVATAGYVADTTVGLAGLLGTNSLQKGCPL